MRGLLFQLEYIPSSAGALGYHVQYLLGVRLALNAEEIEPGVPVMEHAPKGLDCGASTLQMIGVTR